MSPLIFWVALAGAGGALVRYAVTSLIPHRSPGSFPWGVLSVNVIGSLIAGVTLGLVSSGLLTLDFAVVIWAGLCGGLTTLSTFAVDTVLVARHAMSTAWMNIVLSVTLGLAAGVIGFGAVTSLVG